MVMYLTPLGVARFQDWELQCHQRDHLAEGIPVLPHRYLLKHSVAVTWRGGGKPGLLLFSSDIAGFFSALLVSLPTEVSCQTLCAQLWTCSTLAGNRSSKQDMGTFAVLGTLRAQLCPGICSVCFLLLLPWKPELREAS